MPRTRFPSSPSRLGIAFVLVLVSTLVLTSAAAGSASLSSTAALAKLRALPDTATPRAESFRSSRVMFIENVAQWDEHARFQAWGGPAGTMWLAEDGICSSWYPIAARGRSARPHNR